MRGAAAARRGSRTAWASPSRQTAQSQASATRRRGSIAERGTWDAWDETRCRTRVSSIVTSAVGLSGTVRAYWPGHDPGVLSYVGVCCNVWESDGGSHVYATERQEAI